MNRNIICVSVGFFSLRAGRACLLDVASASPAAPIDQVLEQLPMVPVIRAAANGVTSGLTVTDPGGYITVSPIVLRMVGGAAQLSL